MSDPGLAHAAEFRRCLIELDVRGIMRLWAHVSPHLHQPANEREALYTLHLARSNAQSLPLKARQYSHKWLLERGFGSGLDIPLRKGA